MAFEKTEMMNCGHFVEEVEKHPLTFINKIHTKLDVSCMDPHLVWDWTQLTGTSGFVSHHCETIQLLLECCLSHSDQTGAPLVPASIEVCRCDVVFGTPDVTAQRTVQMSCSMQNANSAWKCATSVSEECFPLMWHAPHQHSKLHHLFVLAHWSS